MNFRALSAAMAVVVLGACARTESEPPLFALDQCTRVSLIDAASGAPVIGAEDLDIDRASGRIFVSAYDRRRAEKAAARRAPSIPDGGLYAIDVAALEAGEASLTVRSLIDPARIAAGLRPHGLSFDGQSGAVSFINRGYVAEGGAWRRRIDVVTFNPAGNGSLAASPVHCSANDLAAHAGQMLITLDRGRCGWRAAAADVLGTRSGRVVDGAGAEVLADVGFANGAVRAPNGELVVAATRDRAIHVVAFDGGRAAISKTFKLAGAPDNLTLAGDGRLVAAIHPRLLAIGLQRRLGLGKSPSRVVDIDLATGGQRVLFDDPKAALISAATAAVLTGDLLVIGSVTDSGLVACRRTGAPQ